MRARFLLGPVLVLLPFVALPASAACYVVSPEDSPDVNYTTVCLLDHGNTYNDPSQSADHDYLAHVSHAVEVDPLFEYTYVRSDQGTWTYDDGEVQQDRAWTHIGAGTFAGAAGLVGTGYHANLQQRDQTSPEDGDGACSGVVGRSTCLGAGSWFTVNGVASAGVGAYYQQTYSNGKCEERLEVDIDAVVIFFPIVRELGDCTVVLPQLHEEAPFSEFPALP